MNDTSHSTVSEEVCGTTSSDNTKPTATVISCQTDNNDPANKSKLNNVVEPHDVLVETDSQRLKSEPNVLIENTNSSNNAENSNCCQDVESASFCCIKACIIGSPLFIPVMLTTLALKTCCCLNSATLFTRQDDWGMTLVDWVEAVALYSELDIMTDVYTSNDAICYQAVCFGGPPPVLSNKEKYSRELRRYNLLCCPVVALRCLRTCLPL